MFKKREKCKTSAATYTRLEFVRNWLSKTQGELLHSCSYSKWVDGESGRCGFVDLTDYVTAREPYKRRGILLKHDTMEGRHFMTRLTNANPNISLAIYERSCQQFHTVDIPTVEIPPLQNRLTLRIDKPEVNVIACHDDLLAIQIDMSHNMRYCVVHFMDLEKESFIGFVTVEQQRRRCLECHISPRKARVLLRPIQPTRRRNPVDSYAIRHTNLSDNTTFNVAVIPPHFGEHVFTFNAHLGDDMILCAHEQIIDKLHISNLDLAIYASEERHVVNTPGSIHQIRSSPSGDFIAVRTVDNIYNKEYKTNVVSIINFLTMSVVMNIDAKGAYWPFSEVINLQVFPKFSQTEDSVAIMKNHTTKRKVYIYKLPTTKVLSLRRLSAYVVSHIRATSAHYAIPHLLRDVVASIGATARLPTLESDANKTQTSR